MKRKAAVLALLAGGVALASEPHAWFFAYSPFQGTYSIYGGGLGDPVEPNSRSKSVAFQVTGKVARQMFDAIGPDLKNTCGAGDGQRMRQRDELVCFFEREYGYRCSFGFDLISGRSIGGTIC